MRILLLSFAVLVSSTALKAPAIKLQGYFVCQASIIPGSRDALKCYAPVKHNCQNGAVVLAYEKRISHLDEKAQYEIADTVQLQVSRLENDLAISITKCTAPTGKLAHYFVLSKQDGSGKKHLDNVKRIWGINAQGHLVEMPTKTVQCFNNDYGAY